jgi:hypothetical protein
MRTQNPVNIVGLPNQMQQWAQSLHVALNGGLDLGTATSKDSTGVYNKFQKSNGSGVLIRIGASGTTDNDFAWTASNTGVAINHGLLRQPIGYHVVDMDKNVTVYRTATPDANQITLAPSDATANVTVYVF